MCFRSVLTYVPEGNDAVRLDATPGGGGGEVSKVLVCGKVVVVVLLMVVVR